MVLLAEAMQPRYKATKLSPCLASDSSTVEIRSESYLEFSNSSSRQLQYTIVLFSYESLKDNLEYNPSRRLKYYTAHSGAGRRPALEPSPAVRDITK